MNKIRVMTLLQKECIRFFRVYNQTIISPVINALIFYLIFTVAFSQRVQGFDGASYSTIVSTGLIAMSVLQAAYYNTQSTISIARMLGFIKDYTIAPLTTLEVFIAMVGSSVIRAFSVGIITLITLSFFADFTIQNFAIALYYILAGSVLFAVIGVIVGFISSDFDKAHAYTSYIVTPLTMLSGTFYSAESLPHIWRKIVSYNPVFYIIDGFRFGMTGVGGSHYIGGIIIFIMLVALSFVAGVMLKKGLQN